MDARTAQPAVTLPLEELPDCCPHPGCGKEPPGGMWALGVRGIQLGVICPCCWTFIAPVQAIAAQDPECE